MTMKGVRRRILGFRALGVLLVLAAGTVLLLQVRVDSSGISASCGAPFDVISGRANWQQWFSEDLADPRIQRRLTTRPYRDLPDGGQPTHDDRGHARSNGGSARDRRRVARGT